MKTNEEESYEIKLPTSGTGVKEIRQLYRRRRQQVEKTIKKLKKAPTDFTLKGIEKLQNSDLGDYSIRVAKGDRLFYDVDQKKKIVYLLRAGKHDLYKLT